MGTILFSGRLLKILGTVFCILLAQESARAQSFSLVSLRSDGTPPSVISDGSTQPAVSPNGRFIVFPASATNLLTPDVSGTQIYLRDRQSGTTELISQSSGGIAANNSIGTLTTRSPSISDDGCRVVFESNANNLVAGDNNGTTNIFIRDRCAQPKTTSMVDLTSGSAPASGQGMDGRISPDGRKVAFFSYATDLVPGVTDSGCLYIRDLTSLTTTAVMQQNGHCVAGQVPDLSYDGSKIAYWTLGAYALGVDTNAMWDIYLYDSATPLTPILVSANANGTAQAQGPPGVSPWEGFSTITAPAISRDGRIVAFRSRGYGLLLNNGVPLDTAGIGHVYVKDTQTGEIIAASVDNAGTNLGNFDSSGTGAGLRPGLSADGQYVVFSTIATNLATATGGVTPNIVLHDNFNGGTVGFTNQSIFGMPAISSLGGYIVVYSDNQLDTHFSSRGFFMLNLTTAPAAPTITKLVPGSGRVSVYFNAPGLQGGTPVVSYTASCTGGGATRTMTGTTSPIIVTGLTNGVSYSCTLTATNSAGTSPASAGVSQRISSPILPVLFLLLGT